MTDIDALIAEARDWQSRWDAGRVTAGTNVLIGGLLDALTTERAKVAALEKENAKFRTMLGGSTTLAEGLGIRVDAVMHEVALAAYKQLEEAKAEAARWREVAGELAGAAKDMDGWEECLDPDACNLWAAERDFEALRAAVARFKQEADQ